MGYLIITCIEIIGKRLMVVTEVNDGLGKILKEAVVA
jgi:hypothetical protein